MRCVPLAVAVAANLTLAPETKAVQSSLEGKGLPGVDWETCQTMNATWGFKSEDDSWKTGRTLIRQLIETASKGGNFLLNVGPTQLGEIPGPSLERLALPLPFLLTSCHRTLSSSPTRRRRRRGRTHPGHSRRRRRWR